MTSLLLGFILSGSRRIVVGDSVFGSVKTCVELWNINGLYSNLLVKAAHKKYTRKLLRESDIERGQWVCARAEIDGVKLMATRFLDLQEKLFISSYSTSLDGPLRATKYHGDVPWPLVAYEYLSSSASIDIHNHFRTGSSGLEDAWQTKNANLRQVAGVIGFLFTNAYLAYRHFHKSQIKHSEFKVELANALYKFKETAPHTKRFSLEVPIPDIAKVHVLKLLQKMASNRRGKTTGTKSTTFIASTTLIKPQKSKKPVGTVRHVWAPMVKCTHCAIRKPEESASSSTLSMVYHPNDNIRINNFIIYNNSCWLTTDYLCYMELWNLMSLCYMM